MADNQTNPTQPVPVPPASQVPVPAAPGQLNSTGTAQPSSPGTEPEQGLAQRDPFDIREPDYSWLEAPPVETPAAAEPPASPAPVAPPSIPDDMVARAGQLGISPEEARAYGDAAHLNRTLSIIERNLSILARKEMQQSGQQQPGPAEPQTQPPAAEAEFQINLDDANYDPELVKVIKGLDAHYRKKLATLEEQLQQTTPMVQQMRQQQQQRQAAEFETTVDTLFAGLPEEYADLFGKEPAAQLTADSPSMKERKEVVREMFALAAGYRAQGRQVPPLAQLHDRVVKMLHGGRATEKAKQAAAARVAEQLRDRAGQFVARPTQRQGLPEIGDEAALKAINSFFRERGQEETTQKNGFPK